MKPMIFGERCYIMIRQVNIEPIDLRQDFLETPPITRDEAIAAFEACVKQVEANMDYFQDKFPWSATKELKYPIIENIEWTDGFWTGMLWLCYEYTGDEKFRALAERNVDSFLHRVENKIELDHHDLGFLYSLSCVSGYQLTGSEKAKRAAILAADQLLTRWQEKGQFLQAWGPFNSPEHYRFIIDCMLNIPCSTASARSLATRTMLRSRRSTSRPAASTSSVTTRAHSIPSI